MDATTATTTRKRADDRRANNGDFDVMFSSSCRRYEPASPFVRIVRQPPADDENLIVSTVPSTGGSLLHTTRRTVRQAQNPSCSRATADVFVQVSESYELPSSETSVVTRS